MDGAGYVAAAVLLVIGAYVLTKQDQQQGGGVDVPDVGEWLGSTAQTLTNDLGETLKAAEGVIVGRLNLSKMRDVTGADVAHKNVQAMLRVIRRGEGTADELGYRRMFGGELFDGYAKHPNVRITKTYGGKKLTSTAAGAYQFLNSTWEETARIMGLTDFSPAAQDLGAVGRLAARGALDDVKAGRFEVAIKKIAKEWASMPFSPYGQPVISMATAATIYTQAGGTVA
jgi:muramidase (phage lysozyme)